MKLVSRRISLAAGALLLAGFGTSAIAGDIMVPMEGKSVLVDQIKANGEMRVGVAIAPPWLGQDPNTGQYFGAAFEIGQRIAMELGVDITPVSSGWDVIIAGIQGNQFELAIAPLFATPKRREVVDFVNWTAAGTCYIVLQDSPIMTFEDMNQPGVRIGTYTGTGTEHGIVAKYTEATIDSIVQQVSGAHRIEDVLTGRIDVAPIDDALAFVMAAEYPEIRIIPESPDYCINNSDIPFPVGMAFNYGDPEFKTMLEAIVADMQDQISASMVKYSDPQYIKQ
jgi:ABC-type amino acid transport substrate-binding protein